MSLTRKKLKAFGLNEEQIESVIEEHIETVKALQDDAAKYKADAEKLPDMQRELHALKKELEDGGYQAKYEKEHSDFEAYKHEQNAREERTAKEHAFREIIRAAGISEKRVNAILRVSSLDDLELDENGNVQNAEALTEKVKDEFSDFVVTTTEAGAVVRMPPEADEEADLGKLDMASYIAERKKR